MRIGGPRVYARHGGGAEFIVNNNPGTMDRSPRSFPTAAGWCFRQVPVSQHVAAGPHAEGHRSPSELACVHTSAALRCVSKHEGPAPCPSSSFETRAR